MHTFVYPFYIPIRHICESVGSGMVSMPISMSATRTQDIIRYALLYIRAKYTYFILRIYVYQQTFHANEKSMNKTKTEKPVHSPTSDECQQAASTTAIRW